MDEGVPVVPVVEDVVVVELTYTGCAGGVKEVTCTGMEAWVWHLV